ncbi:MAG: hypothetical protein H6704_04835 [Myxococcales bacterium]|nr:hypothetical protein [Myxococcales bacterium]
MKTLTPLLRAATLVALAGCGARPPAAPPTPEAEALAAVTLPPLPDWTDRYADQNQGDPRFFVIEEVMRRYDLSRLAAVEAQNHFRDLRRPPPDAAAASPWTPPSATEAWATAVARAKAGTYESGLDPAALERAPFIVVFDLDDTLYAQYHLPEGCGDVDYVTTKGQAKRIQMTPGWAEAIGRIRDAGGEVALFSANLDDATLENLGHIQLQGKPLLGHPAIAGVLTNSHLVLQSKHEGPGREAPKDGRPVVEPSKDLRVFDETLERVIIVDDNPLRLFQYGNVRLFKKFHGDVQCGDQPARKDLQAGLLAVVADEVVEAAAYAKDAGLSFAAAYRPYTMLGQVAVDAAMRSLGLDRKAAIAFVRAHADVVDARF